MTNLAGVVQLLKKEQGRLTSSPPGKKLLCQRFLSQVSWARFAVGFTRLG